MTGATTPMLEGQPGFAQAWLYGKMMHLSLSMKVLGDTKKSPEEVGTAPQYPGGPCIPALCKSREQAKTLLQASQEARGVKGRGSCAPPRLGHSLSFLGVQVTEGDSIEGVVSSEEQSETQSEEYQGQGSSTTGPPQPSSISPGDTAIGTPLDVPRVKDKAHVHDQVDAIPGTSFTNTLPESQPYWLWELANAGFWPEMWPWRLLLPLVVR